MNAYFPGLYEEDERFHDRAAQDNFNLNAEQMKSLKLSGKNLN